MKGHERKRMSKTKSTFKIYFIVSILPSRPKALKLQEILQISTMKLHLRRLLQVVSGKMILDYMELTMPLMEILMEMKVTVDVYLQVSDVLKGDMSS